MSQRVVISSHERNGLVHPQKTMPAPRPMVQASGIVKAFRSTPVLQGIDLHVNAGEAVGLIGPNGAGKTTLFNILSGFIAPDAGSVLLDGEPVTRLDVQSRARMGLVRTFQKSLVFPAMSVRRNVAMAARASAAVGYQWWRSAAAMRRADEQAQVLIEQAGLQDRADTLASDLSYGEQRILDLLIALAQRPRVLLLDEPTAGLSEAQAQRLIQVMTTLHSGIATLLVSHDLDVVFQVCTRIAVLDLGVVIACGNQDAIRADARVISAYLGMPADTLQEAG